MLENERIIVQDRGGIDAGIAALMQNANKGFDPAALMAMMNNGNGMFGGNGGWWWIFIIVLFWMWGGWGGNGFGRGNQAETNSDFARLAAMGNQNNNTDLLMQAINGNKDAINTLSTNLNCDVKSIDNALCSIQNAIGKVGGEVGFSAERVINAVNAGDCNVIKAISDCCCTTQRSIDSVNLNLTQMNADNRLSICQQTNTLQNAITSGFNTLSSENATRFNILGAKIDAQTQIINDKFCQLEMREMQNKIDTLRDEKNALQSSALLQQQTSNIVSQIRPCPVPAYLTCNPYGCNGGLNGYGYGYPYGYTVVSVSKPYDEPVPPTQFPMPMQNRRKLVDLVISCDGEQRKLSVSEDKTMMTDSSIGLTIATEKSQIVNMVRQSLDDCRIKKESLSKIDEEMRRCEDILKILNVNSDITTNVTKDFKELDDLKAEVKELKQLLQNVSAVRPEVIKNTPPNSTEDKKVEPEGEIKKEI